MKDETEKLVRKAARALHAAELLFRENDLESAASRAYYAMFYAAEALLQESGLGFRKHAGVHAVFGERFAKTKLVDPKLHRWLLDAFDRRIRADCGMDIPITDGDLATMIGQAREFLDEAVHLGLRIGPVKTSNQAAESRMGFSWRFRGPLFPRTGLRDNQGDRAPTRIGIFMSAAYYPIHTGCL